MNTIERRKGRRKEGRERGKKERKKEFKLKGGRAKQKVNSCRQESDHVNLLLKRQNMPFKNEIDNKQHPKWPI